MFGAFKSSVPSASIINQFPGCFCAYNSGNPSANRTFFSPDANLSSVRDLVNYRAISQATANKQPVWKPQSFNNRNSILYDGTSDGFQISDLDTVSGSGSYTIFFVVNILITAQRWLLDTNSGSNRLILTNRGYDSGGGQSATGTAQTGQQILTWRFDANATTGRMYRGLTLIASGTYTGRAFGSTTGIGSDSPVSVNFFSGYMHSWGLFNYAFTDDEHTSLIRLLRKISGVSI